MGVSTLCTDPEQKYLYATVRGSQGVASFGIDPESGALDPLSTASVDGRPGYMNMDKTGKYLFTAYFGDGAVSVNAIDENGAVLAPHHQWVPLEEHAHCVYADRSNQFLYVPHTMPANTIYQFTFDETIGKITPNDPAKVDPPLGEGPRHFEFHPTLDFVYFSNENGSSVTVYDLDAETGGLVRRQNISTLPSGYVEDNSCAQIHIHPSGKFLYVGNRGHNSIARFAVQEDGALESLGQTPTEPTVRGFNLDPDGIFLFAAGIGSGKMASYRIDANTGDLVPLKVYDVGKQPMWILVLKLDR
jgi:6-phosphogluconolactonase